MTIRRYTREYSNSDGPDPNVPEVHGYDRTKPGQPCPHQFVGPSGVRHSCFRTMAHEWHECRCMVLWQDQHEKNTANYVATSDTPRCAG